MTVGARTLVATYIEKYTVLELLDSSVRNQMVTRFRPGTPPQIPPVGGLPGVITVKTLIQIPEFLLVFVYCIVFLWLPAGFPTLPALFYNRLISRLYPRRTAKLS